MLHLFGRQRDQTDAIPGLRLERLEARENPVAFYTVPGTAGTATALDFSWVDRQAAFYSEIGVYQVDNASGSVGGIAPSDPNYATVALATAVPVFGRGQTEGARSIQGFSAGTTLGFYMVQNSTLAIARTANPANAALGNGAVVFFSFASAAPDLFDHTRAAVIGTQTVVQFEDGLRGGDQDFNDTVIRVRPLDPNVTVGAAGQLVPTTFQLNQRDAAYSGEIGVYAFDNTSGAVDGVAPDDDGYAAAVLRSARRTALFAPGAAAGTLAVANLPAGGNFGFYMIRGGTSAQLLGTNPTNSTLLEPVMYFSVSPANPDDMVHVRQDGSTLYFEDGLRGGDQDFNDAVVSFVTSGTAGVGPAPAIGAIGDQVTNQNSPTAAIPFTVSSAAAPATALTVTATSSNQALVPDANIALGGTGPNRTVTITPVDNQNGATTITLTVSDGIQTATRTFTLTVNPIVAPNFTASNPPTANFNAGAQSVANFATFVPSANGGTTPTYTVSNVSNTGLFTVQPAVASDGTLTYTPRPGAFGSATFTVRVNDGVNNSAAKTFTIRVDPVQGLSPTTIPGTTINLAAAGWTTIPTLVAAGNSAGIPAGTVTDGTRILDTVVGSGAAVQRGNQVTVAYKGYLLNGTIFDQNTSAQFTASETALIPGFAAGLIGMRVGGTRYIDIPSHLAYGGSPPSASIPVNARLVFEVTVNSIP